MRDDNSTEMHNFLGNPAFWTPQQKEMVALMDRLDELSARMDERLDCIENDAMEISKDLAWMDGELEEEDSSERTQLPESSKGM